MTEQAEKAEKTAKPAAEEKTLAQQIAEELLQKLQSHTRRLTRVRGLLQAVKGGAPSASSYTAWLELNRGLDGYEIGVPELDEKRVQLLEEVQKGMERMRMKTRIAFVTTMEKRASEQKINLQKISDVPLVLYAEPLTFEIDFDRGSARVLYGHEPISDVAIDANRLFDERARALRDIEKQALEPAAFFDLLRTAYRTVLAVNGLKAGERVDLVDVLVPLAMLRVSAKDLRKKGVDALKPFTRYQLAWQLNQLRREAMLERDGVRLDIGAATGGSTRDKQNVLYIPLGPTDGQYYGSIRFT